MRFENYAACAEDLLPPEPRKAGKLFDFKSKQAGSD
jgi:hypothetical protein